MTDAPLPSLLRPGVTDDPWLRIPAADYEAHMQAIGQSAVLREAFSAVCAERRPSRLAILGCTTGADLPLVDPAVTELVVGVDLNPDYLELARRRGAALGSRLQLVLGNVLQVALPPVPFDVVDAALLLEYVEPLALLRRMHQWVSPHGVCSVVTQEPTTDAKTVSATPYDSLRALAGRMTVRSAEEIAALAEGAGLRRVEARSTTLANGKTLVHATFERRIGS